MPTVAGMAGSLLRPGMVLGEGEEDFAAPGSEAEPPSQLIGGVVILDEPDEFAHRRKGNALLVGDSR